MKEAEEVFQEKFTGITAECPQFNMVLQKSENGDALIVTKLDRLARNIREVLEIVQSLMVTRIQEGKKLF